MRIACENIVELSDDVNCITNRTQSGFIFHHLHCLRAKSGGRTPEDLKCLLLLPTKIPGPTPVQSLLRISPKAGQFFRESLPHPRGRDFMMRVLS